MNYWDDKAVTPPATVQIKQQLWHIDLAMDSLSWLITHPSSNSAYYFTQLIAMVDVLKKIKDNCEADI